MNEFIVLQIIAGYILCGLLSWAIDWVAWQKLMINGEVAKYPDNGKIVYVTKPGQVTMKFRFHMYGGPAALFATFCVFIIGV